MTVLSNMHSACQLSTPHLAGRQASRRMVGKATPVCGFAYVGFAYALWSLLCTDQHPCQMGRLLDNMAISSGVEHHQDRGGLAEWLDLPAHCFLSA